MMMPLLLALALSLGIQAVFFAFAATLRTDKVTDLSYGLTFAIIALTLPWYTGVSTLPALVLVGMVVLWAARLAGYLFFRILRMKRDRRFDGVREDIVKFLTFWAGQGLLVWLIMVPVILWFSRQTGDAGPPAVLAAGAGLWLLGLVLETVADLQKFRYKSREGEASRWMSTGLWRYSRHPNYFGELLCWWGVFVFVVPGLGGWAVPALVGPLSLTVILLYVTGIPPLEASAQRKWGDDPAYQAYRRRTNRLVPWPPRSDEGA